MKSSSSPVMVHNSAHCNKSFFSCVSAAESLHSLAPPHNVRTAVSSSHWGVGGVKRWRRFMWCYVVLLCKSARTSKQIYVWYTKQHVTGEGKIWADNFILSSLSFRGVKRADLWVCWWSRWGCGTGCILLTYWELVWHKHWPCGVDWSLWEPKTGPDVENLIPDLVKTHLNIIKQTDTPTNFYPGCMLSVYSHSSITLWESQQPHSIPIPSTSISSDVFCRAEGHWD